MSFEHFTDSAHERKCTGAIAVNAQRINPFREAKCLFGCLVWRVDQCARLVSGDEQALGVVAAISEAFEDGAETTLAG